MSPDRETLDEAIDRVTSSLTHVSGETARAAGVIERLADPRATVGLRQWFVPACAIAVVLLTVLWSGRSGQPRGPASALAPVPKPLLVVAARHAIEPQRPHLPDEALPATLDRVPAAVPHSNADMRAVAPMPMPEELHIEALGIRALDVAPVELRPLDLAELVVPGLWPSSDAKE